MRTACVLCAALLAVATGRADDFKPEDGFALLFNGKDLSGWKTEKGESLDGKAEAFNGRFKVADGVLTIDPAVKGDVKVFTARELGKDVHIKFDFKPDGKCNNDLYLRGLKFDLKKPDVKNLKENEWNSFELIIAGDRAEFRNNGETLKTVPVKGKAGTFGLRAEFGSMQVRRLRVKEG
jgi:hypothetical protein